MLLSRAGTNLTYARLREVGAQCLEPLQLRVHVQRSRLNGEPPTYAARIPTRRAAPPLVLRGRCI